MSDKVIPSIVELKEILKLNLSIPTYQRPYRWSKESAILLFNDVCAAFESHLLEYRMGTVVLHNENESFRIVDGQQRLTTISILLFCLNELEKIPDFQNYSTLLNAEQAYNDLSTETILNNHAVLRKKCKELKFKYKGSNDFKDFSDYLLDNCTFVKIVTNDEQEAFQFFDSQNSRGKELDPHDLLKSYHLREMESEKEEVRKETVKKWEDINQKELATFFSQNLYPLVRWYKNKDALYYSVKKIQTFKGIKQNSSYNFSVYHKASNLYIEHFNADGIFELTAGEKVPQFQLTQPLISGKRFFEYTHYYFDLHVKVEDVVKDRLGDEMLPVNGNGEKYVRELFINVVMFFVDRFNFEALTDNYLMLMYRWCYTLRLAMHAVYMETVNNYALGRWEREGINKGLNLFNVISEIQSPSELDSIVLTNITEDLIKKYQSDKYLDTAIWKIGFQGENK